jgi:stage V sporulation protein G
VEITDVQVKLADHANGRLRAYCSIVLDHVFVVREIKVIDGTNGLFVAMPTRTIQRRCQECVAKSDVDVGFCTQCGAKQPSPPEGRKHADTVHPITKPFRLKLESRVLAEVEAKLLVASSVCTCRPNQQNP